MIRFMLRPRCVTAAVLASLCATLPAHAQTTPVLPGFWESAETYSVLLGGSSKARKCLSAAQISQFLDAPGTGHYQCTYKGRRFSDGRASFSGGECFSHNGRHVLSKVAIEGTYAPERFDLDFRFELLVSAGVGLPGTARIEAHRVSADCPAAAPPSH